MIQQEWKEASLHKVIETTLDEYVEESNRTPYRGTNYRPDKCGYICQILDKVEEEKQRSEGEQ